MNTTLMPRTSTDEDTPKKRAPRKRAPRKTASTTAARRSAPKKSTSNSTDSAGKEERVSARTEERPVRKAPTPIAARRADSQAKRKQWLITAVILVVGVGTSAAIGFTDQGQIDVNQAIEERNARIQSGQLRDGDTQRVIVPVQNTQTNKLPDGGLIGLGVGAAPPAPAPEVATTTATSTATSTDATATSTTEVEGEADVDTPIDSEEAPTEGPPEEPIEAPAASPTSSDTLDTEAVPTSGR